MQFLLTLQQLEQDNKAVPIQGSIENLWKEQRATKPHSRSLGYLGVAGHVDEDDLWRFHGDLSELVQRELPVLGAHGDVIQSSCLYQQH